MTQSRSDKDKPTLDDLRMSVTFPLSAEDDNFGQIDPAETEGVIVDPRPLVDLPGSGRPINLSGGLHQESDVSLASGSILNLRLAWDAKQVSLQWRVAGPCPRAMLWVALYASDPLHEKPMVTDLLGWFEVGTLSERSQTWRITANDLGYSPSERRLHRDVHVEYVGIDP